MLGPKPQIFNRKASFFVHSISTLVKTAQLIQYSVFPQSLRIQQQEQEQTFFKSSAIHKLMFMGKKVFIRGIISGHFFMF